MKHANHDTGMTWHGPHSALHADGVGPRMKSDRRPDPNPAVHCGDLVIFAAWPPGPENPPRRVTWINPLGVCGLAPLPGARVFARSGDLRRAE
jgi:hypothetical protein